MTYQSFWEYLKKTRNTDDILLKQQLMKIFLKYLIFVNVNLQNNSARTMQNFLFDIHVILPPQIPFQFLIPSIVLPRACRFVFTYVNVVATTCERRLFLTGATKTLSFRLMDHFSFPRAIVTPILLARFRSS